MKSALFRCLITAMLTCIGTTPALSQLLVAHRGASADAPENTLRAFQLAFQQGADAIEGDCYLTLDNQIIVTHDETTERVSGVTMKVAETEFGKLRDLDVGSWMDPKFSAERMPNLAEIFQLLPRGKLFFIEIKCGPEILPQLQAHLADLKIDHNQIRIICFNRDVVKAAKLAFPDIECYWLFQFRQDKTHSHWYPTTASVIATAQAINADGVDVRANMELVDQAFVTACREAGLSLHAWTVDDPAVALQLQELGFDSVTTNRPGFLRQAMRAPVKNVVPRSEATPVDATAGELERVGSN